MAWFLSSFRITWQCCHVWWWSIFHDIGWKLHLANRLLIVTNLTYQAWAWAKRRLDFILVRHTCDIHQFSLGPEEEQKVNKSSQRNSQFELRMKWRTRHLQTWGSVPKNGWQANQGLHWYVIEVLNCFREVWDRAGLYLAERISPLSCNLVGSFRGAQLLFLWTLLKRVPINGVTVMSTLISKLMFVYTYITGPPVYSHILSVSVHITTFAYLSALSDE